MGEERGGENLVERLRPRVLGVAHERDLHRTVPQEIEDPRTKALDQVLSATFLAQRVIARGDGSASTSPLLRGKTLVNGTPAVYICRNYACDLPITDPGALVARLRA